MKSLLTVLSIFLLSGCTASPTEPTTPSPTPAPTIVPTAIPTPTPALMPTPTPTATNVLQGHFVGSGIDGIVVTVTQDITGSHTSATTTTDVTGFYSIAPLKIGPASILGVAKNKCCWTGQPTQIHAGVNVLDIPVVFY